MRVEMNREGSASAMQDLARARELVLRHGWNATAYQLLNPGIHFWFAPGGEGLVGYVDSHGVRVVAGAPVCGDDRFTEVVRDFERDAEARGLRVCYFCAGTRLVGALQELPVHRPVVIGAQPAWDPEEWEGMLGCHASLRAQLNRARNKEVVVSEWPAWRASTDPGIRRCLTEWLDSRGLPPLHFLIEPWTLQRLFDRRIFVAERHGVVVAFLVASPIPARHGWLVEQLVRGHNAPNGTAEALIDAAVRTAREVGSHYLTLGLAPLSMRAGALGVGGPAWLRGLLGWMRVHVRRFYNFEGLEAFKAKFRPAVWEPIYAVAAGPEFTPRMLYAIAGAFSDRSVPSTVGRAFAGALKQEVRWLRARLS